MLCFVCQEVTFIANSNLFLAFVQSQEVTMRKNLKKIDDDLQLLFITTFAIVYNCEFISHAEKVRKKFDYRDLPSP